MLEAKQMTIAIKNLCRLARATADDLLCATAKRHPKRRCSMCGQKRYIKVDGVCHSCWEAL
jgi:hypothetical protein